MQPITLSSPLLLLGPWRSRRPLLHGRSQLPSEFLAFLQDEYEARDDDYPFLVELAHYEYIELALSISEDSNDMQGIDAEGDLLAGAPVKSVLCWMYGYEFPVHRISSDFKPDAPLDQPVFLAVYRRDDDSVGFLELNPVSARLLEAIEQNDTGQSGEALLRALADELNYADVDSLVGHGATALEEMRQLGILTGTQAPA